jgi:hypothetical protein
MPSMTVRDIPGEMLNTIKVLSERERRSINKQFLVIVEDGLKTHTAALERGRESGPSPSLQLALWRDIAGKWEDERSTAEIIADIRRNRTIGREVQL